jgi:hypothetical protein
MAAKPGMRFLYLLLIVIALGAATGWSVSGQNLQPLDAGTSVNGFQDEFSNLSLGNGWAVAGANVYTVNQGRLRIASATGDPNHLLYAVGGYANTVQEVLVRMRVVRFGGGPYSRGGIGVAVDAASSQGINFTFRDDDGAGHPGRHMALLDDYREWGPVLNFAWQTNTWYWLRLRQEPNAASGGAIQDVFAKIWPADGLVAEPASWQLLWDYNGARSTRAGYAGLMAGSTAGGATDFSEFEVDYFLLKATGLPAVVVGPAALAPVPVAITNQPRSQSVAELAAVTFQVGAIGNPSPTYQWFREEQAIPGGTNQSYGLPRTLLSEHGARFKVVAANTISNLTHSVTSLVVTLTVLADVTAPTFVAVESVGLGAVQVQFSERLEERTATNLAHYILTGPRGPELIAVATLEPSHASVRLQVNPPLTENAVYTLTVDGPSDEAAAANIIRGASQTFTARKPAVFITEFVAENTIGLRDVDGAYSDWLELQNQSVFSVDLAGWQLIDNPNRAEPWTFPSVMLAPGQFLVVFASGKDRRVAGEELHTNFRLDAGGEYVGLIRPDGSMANEFHFGAQKKDASFGLSSGTNLFMLSPTPGAANAAGVYGFVEDIEFQPRRGFFTNSVSVTLTSTTANAEIWWTRDGSLPTPGNPGSLRYTGPVLLSSTTMIRARAYRAGYAPTDIDTHTFLSVASTANQPVNPVGFPGTWCSTDWSGYGCYTADYGMDGQVVTNARPGYGLAEALRALPAVSLVAPSADLFGAERGIYYESFPQGEAYEREVSIELIFPDGTEGFQHEAGLRIHGYTSRSHRNTLKHSLRVSFRNRFGPSKLNYPLFPDTAENDFDQLVLRACSTDSYPIVEGGTRWESRRATYLRDQWMRDALRDLGQPTAHGRYVHLWLNGLYWGVYNLTEALGTGWAAEHLGGAKEDYDVIKDYLLVDHGEQQAWDEATSLAAQGFATEADYQRIQGLNPDGTRNTNYPIYLNISNLVDYMIVHITAGAEDWDFNNWWCCRRRGPESIGFRFCAWDQEISNESLTRQLNVFGQRFEEVNTYNRPSYFYDRLRNTSPSFRQFFRDRVWQTFTAEGSLTPQRNAARWTTRQQELDHAIVAESARWGDARREPPFTRENNWLPEMAWVANYWASNHTRVIERFRRVNLWPLLAAPSANRSSGFFTNNVELTLTHTNVSGVLWFTLDNTDPRAVTGGPAATAQRYAGPLTISTATRVQARVTDGVNWSAPFLVGLYPLQVLTNLVVSEIYYHPPAPPDTDADEFEFIELHNAGLTPLDLTGIRFTTGIQFTFTNGTEIAPGGFVVLARNQGNFAARFPGVAWHGLYSGKLANEGETLTLTHPLGGTIVTFTYQDRAPWPASADGAGHSLHRFHSGDPSDPANWCATLPTPGAAAPSACLDADQDGLPDAWEQEHNLNPGVPNGRDGAQGDPDGDGVTNLQEYIAGTDPLDPGSYLRIQQISANSPVTLTFVVPANRAYSVQSCNAPGFAEWTTLYAAEARTTNRMETAQDATAGTRRFYRLVATR